MLGSLRARTAFTLLELLIVIGVIGVLITIVIVAVNPVKQLTMAYDTDRVSHKNQTQKAITQYLIDKWELPQKSKLKEGKANAIEICGPDAPSNDPSCAKLSDDLVAAFLGKMPVDPAAPCPVLRTGYAVYLQDGFIQVESLYMGKTPGQITTPCPTVPPITTTTVLAMTPVNPAAGQNVTLTATVTASDGQTPTGSVTFYDGSTPIPGGTVTLDASGRATLPNVPVSAGVPHTFSASYGGVVGTGPGGLGSYGVSNIALSPLTIPLIATTTSLDASPASAAPGQTVTLTATVTAASGTPTGTVTFYDGVASIGSASITAGTATLATSSLSVSSHTLKATYGGSATHSESTSASQTVAVTVPPPTALTLLSGGQGFALARKSDGTVWAWGTNLVSNQFGQFGNGTTTNTMNLTQVSGLTNVVTIGAGGDFGAALKGDGTVWTWGHNTYGQLGNGTSGYSNYTTTPAQVPGLSDVSAIAVGNQHILALKSDGTVWAWGYNLYGQLAKTKSTVVFASPSQITLPHARAIGAGGFHSFVILDDGSLWAFGENSYGQLGRGTTFGNGDETPTKISSLSNVTFAGGGDRLSYAITSDGKVWLWGRNNFGQLCINSTTDKSSPFESTLTNVVALAGGMNHTVVIKNDNTVWACGNNGIGQLGNGTYTNQSLPVQSNATGFNGAVAMGAGGMVSMALTSDGKLWTWGSPAPGGASPNVPTVVTGF